LTVMYEHISSGRYDREDVQPGCGSIYKYGNNTSSTQNLHSRFETRSQAYLEWSFNPCVSRFRTLWCQKTGGMAVAQNRITEEETTGSTTASLIILIHE